MRENRGSRQIQGYLLGPMHCSHSRTGAKKAAYTFYSVFQPGDQAMVVNTRPAGEVGRALEPHLHPGLQRRRILQS
eukprot:scaffold17227_cov157-Isochrysis_galbana.AAC.1